MPFVYRDRSVGPNTASIPPQAPETNVASMKDNRTRSLEIPPRRILALSGGGVRGIVEVAFLEAVEAAVKARFGPDKSLCDAFHLVGGTSTGALIATAVALALPLAEIKDFYLTRAASFFSRRRWWAWGQAPIFNSDQLEAEIRRTIGDLTLGDTAFRSHLAIVTKRLDTGSAWIINNIPSAPYYDDSPDGAFYGNRHYDVARLLRAATAAPVFFRQAALEIGPGQKGTFVDGGLSSYQDPSLALFKLARLKAFGLNWPVGVDQLFVLSIGTGRMRQSVEPETAARIGPLHLAFRSLMGMAYDTETHALTMMQALGQTVLPQHINSEIGDLAEDCLAHAPLFKFLRLDLPLDPAVLDQIGLSDFGDLQRYRRMDDPKIIEPLYDLTKAYVAKLPDIGHLVFGDEEMEISCAE